MNPGSHNQGNTLIDFKRPHLPHLPRLLLLPMPSLGLTCYCETTDRGLTMLQAPPGGWVGPDYSSRKQRIRAGTPNGSVTQAPDLCVLRWRALG
ncbi:hypothetical protein NDU88_003112 [Pleurodeles waltl]|uniref:Uncharacterized protein n=1 Tax=Pleurodeles waltl TaxID=8319 RepID=A0AAV7LHW1_PLEWA|nr:hypothetical protein NDU88_003112 [Pleurodeles waltl]